MHNVSSNTNTNLVRFCGASTSAIFTLMSAAVSVSTNPNTGTSGSMIAPPPTLGGIEEATVDGHGCVGGEDEDEDHRMLVESDGEECG